LGDDQLKPPGQIATVSAKTVEQSMRATFAMLAAMEFECRLLGLCATKGTVTEEKQSREKLLKWLRCQVPFIDALAKSPSSDPDLQTVDPPLTQAHPDSLPDATLSYLAQAFAESLKKSM
jgi:hypothetical protein